MLSLEPFLSFPETIASHKMKKLDIENKGLSWVRL